MTDIFVVGYPRSGTCWMTWLLSDILDSPIEKSYSPLAYEDVGREGPHLIWQLHAVPMRGRRGKLVNGDQFINLSHIGGKKLVHMIRDPRDISVSHLYYFTLSNIMDILVWMGGEDHEWSLGKPVEQIFVDIKLDKRHEWIKQGWSAYVSNWKNCSRKHSVVFYEDLLRDAKGCLTRLMIELGFDVDEEQITQAIARQSFEVKREQIEDTLHLRFYGPKIQMKNLRKGIAGDWKNHYTRRDAKLAQEIFGDMMLKLGYIKDRKWWEQANLPPRD